MLEDIEVVNLFMSTTTKLTDANLGRNTVEGGIEE